MDITALIAETRALVDADAVSYPSVTGGVLDVLMRRLNAAYEEVVMLIQGCDGRWQFDDSNYTTFPIGTTTLVANQKDYSFDSSMLEIERVQILDNGGIWQLLNPIDISEIGSAVDEFLKTSGLPQYYDKQGSSLLLYPSPDSGASVTLASGLKVFFKRTASIYTAPEVTTGTKQPGFASPFHMILAYKAAIPYANAYKKDRIPALINEVNRFERELKIHYGRREQDRRKVMSMAGISHR